MGIIDLEKIEERVKRLNQKYLRSKPTKTLLLGECQYNVEGLSAEDIFKLACVRSSLNLI